MQFKYVIISSNEYRYIPPNCISIMFFICNNNNCLTADHDVGKKFAGFKYIDAGVTYNLIAAVMIYCGDIFQGLQAEGTSLLLTLRKFDMSLRYVKF